jgi:hypothetical protein
MSSEAKQKSCLMTSLMGKKKDIKLGGKSYFHYNTMTLLLAVPSEAKD